MSTLNVDALVGNTSANSITVRGEGSATTSLQQGLTKVWIQFNATGTQAIQGSFNVASITDEAAGSTTVTIANDMDNNDYSVTVAGNSDQTAGNVGLYSGCAAINTTDCKVTTRRDNTLVDSSIFGVQIAGDLA